MRRPKRIAIPLDVGDEAGRRHSANEWAEALEGFFARIEEGRWINHPTRTTQASRKLTQLDLAKRIGLVIPSTLLTQDETEARQFLAEFGRVVVKPLSGGYLERASPEEDTQVYTSRIEKEHGQHLGLVSRCPTLFQAEVEKEFDSRVCVVDGRLVAVGMRRRGQDGKQLLDIRRNNMEGVEYFPLEVPADVAAKLRTLVGSLGLRFAAVDFAVDVHGEWVFFEVNASGQWAWLDLAGVADVAGELMMAMRRN
ncbi:hypothetical protein LXT21_44315 [Myxococcus sp. K38C18041901]|nr:hypothetical protein [Myxococcus guangdongensis]